MVTKRLSDPAASIGGKCRPDSPPSCQLLVVELAFPGPTGLFYYGRW